MTAWSTISAERIVSTNGLCGIPPRPATSKRHRSSTRRGAASCASSCAIAVGRHAGRAAPPGGGGAPARRCAITAAVALDGDGADAVDLGDGAARQGRVDAARPGGRRRDEDQELHAQLRPAAPGGARRAAPRPRARRRGGRARRPAHRPPPPRHREADRVQELPAGAAVLRPPRLRLDDGAGAGVLDGGGDADEHDGAAPRAGDPHDVPRDHADPQPPARRHVPRDGRRRAHADALGVRGAREADGVLRARLGRADARRLHPPRRRPRRPPPRPLRRHRRVLRAGARAAPPSTPPAPAAPPSSRVNLGPAALPTAARSSPAASTRWKRCSPGIASGSR